jgi:hypothetical protein
MDNHKEVKEEFDAGNLFGRGVVYPLRKNPFSIYNETFLEHELRKVSREYNKQTAIKEKGNKRGNPNRSVFHLTPNSPLFVNLGYAISNPDIKDILSISDCENGTGEGKKSDLSAHIQSLNTISKNLELMKVKAQDPEFNNVMTEIILNIYNDEKIRMIYFNSDTNDDTIYKEKTNPLFNSLQAVYMKDKFVEILDKNLSIYSYSRESKALEKFEYNNKKLTNIFDRLVSEAPHIIDNIENVNLISHFSEVIKHSDSKDIILNKYNQTSDNFLQKEPNGFNDYYHLINIAKAYKSMGFETKSDEIIINCLNGLTREIPYHNSKLINSFVQLQETRNLDFRLQENLQVPQTYYNLNDSDIIKTSSYLTRFITEMNKNSMSLVSDKAKKEVMSKIMNNNILSKKSVGLLAMKAAKYISRGL